jgi:hypothetical protein
MITTWTEIKPANGNRVTSFARLFAISCSRCNGSTLNSLLYLKRMSLQPSNRRPVFGDIMADSIRKFQRGVHLLSERYR